ncbi:Spore wall protein [Cucumispora dikerogammari]|nr:Spore wall protein [Cucumispora dikerogammari]
MLLSLLKTIFCGLDPIDLTTGNFVKELNLKIYYSSLFKEYELKEGEDLDKMILSVISDTEDKLNSLTTIGKNPVQISFKPEISYELPKDIPLDGCYKKDTDLVNVLNVLNTFEPEMNSIVILNCNSQAYNDLFAIREIKTPIVTLESNILCPKRALIFVETDNQEFLKSMATALITIAGAQVKNPVDITKVMAGDDGIKFKVSIKSDAIEQIRTNVCFLAKVN